MVIFEKDDSLNFFSLGDLKEKYFLKIMIILGFIGYATLLVEIRFWMKSLKSFEAINDKLSFLKFVLNRVKIFR